MTGRASSLQILVDLRQNTLTVELGNNRLPCSDQDGEVLTGTVDVGVEVGELYLELGDAPPGTGQLIRSAEVPMTVIRNGAGTATGVCFSRTGLDYEISLPSGNQCWRVGSGGSSNGELRVCSVVIS